MTSPQTLDAPAKKPRRADSLRAEAAFLKLIDELGARLADGASYQGRHEPVDLICGNGHPCSPRPGNILNGQGLCHFCAGRRDQKTAEADFRAVLAELGATPAPGATYRNGRLPFPVICAAGHRCAPRPEGVLAGKGICRPCGGNCPIQAAAAFDQELSRQGARRAPGAVYQGADKPVDVICAAGHRCAPLPRALQQGQGACRECLATFDRVYLLAHTQVPGIKVGVASGPARVKGHVRRGYQLVAQWDRVEHAAALAAEKTILTTWRANGIPPLDVASGVPRDGRTETADATQLPSTVAALTELLGTPTAQRHPGVAASADPVPTAA